MSPLWWIWSSFCFFESMVAIYLNSYIVFFYGRSLTEGGRKNPISLIHIIIGINKMTLQCIWIVRDVACWVPAIFSLPFFEITISFFGAFHFHLIYWLTTWLSIYYSIFINNFSHQTFVWIKRNLLALLPQVLLLTVLGSMAMSVLYILSRKAYVLRQNSIIGMQNVSSQIERNMLYYMISAITFGYCLPFTVTVILLLVSLSSVLKHVKNISQTSINVQVHFTLIKSMVAFIILSVITFLCYMINLTKVYKPEDPLGVIIQFLLMMAPTMESIIIIKASPQLRKNFPSWFCIRGATDD